MEIKTIEYNGAQYLIFIINIGGQYYSCAEEKLDNLIVEHIENDMYHLVEHIDDMYGYVVPQEIADTQNENEIIESIKDAIDTIEWLENL